MRQSHGVCTITQGEVEPVTQLTNKRLRPLISVVMPVYNGERYIRSSIATVCEQTFRHFELIVIDDGSTDNSLSLVKAIANIDSRVRIIKQSHSGIVAAMNKGCEAARSSYIARFDCDDLAVPSRLLQQYEYLEANPSVTLVGGSVQCIDMNGEYLFSMCWPTANEGLVNHLLVDCCISHTVATFRKQAFLRIGGYREEYQDAEDYDLFLRLAETGNIDNLPTILGSYRIHTEQVSSARATQQILCGIAARLSTKRRRASRPEPVWAGPTISEVDLLALGVSSRRIQELCAAYNTSYECVREGWRWLKSPFLKRLAASEGRAATVR